MTISRDDLLKIAGVTKPSPAVMANAQSLANVLAGYGQKFGLNLPHRVAQFLAQAAHETGGFKYDREIWGPTPAQKRYDTRADLGNTPAADGDGELYKGRGSFQLTGKANYQAFLSWCRLQGMQPPDFIVNPDAINTDPWEGLSAVFFWSRADLNRLADENNIEQITKRINGGLNGFDDRVHFYVRAALVLLGYEPTDVAGFQKWAQGEKLLPADEPGKPSQVDGDAGPKTRAAMHMALVKRAPEFAAPTDVAASPVVQTVETQVPVAAKGADKVGITRAIGAVSLLGAPITAFGGLDNVTKAIVAGVAVVAILLLLLRGEQIAAQTKAILRSFES